MQNEAGGRGGAISTFNTRMRIEGAEFKQNSVAPYHVESDQVFGDQWIALGGGVFLRYSMGFKDDSDQRIAECRFVDNVVKTSDFHAWSIGGGGVCVTVDTNAEIAPATITLASEFDRNQGENGPDIYLIGTNKMRGVDALEKSNNFPTSVDRANAIKLLQDIRARSSRD
jgi:hypothetical protein